MTVTAAMLGVILEAGEGVSLLIDGLDEAQFLRSRLTRHEVQRQVRAIADAARAMDPADRAAMPEIDWPAWLALADAAAQPGSARDAGTWFVARSLVPATLLWLQVYRQSEPTLFEFRIGGL